VLPVNHTAFVHANYPIITGDRYQLNPARLLSNLASIQKETPKELAVK
jgi:hypothetical protein